MQALRHHSAVLLLSVCAPAALGQSIQPSDAETPMLNASAPGVRALGLAARPGFQLSGNLLGFLVREVDQQIDLNGDGDTFDDVVHVHAVGANATTNLGLATTTVLVVDDPFVVFYADEFDQQADLNGDGVLDDAVLHVYDIRTGTTTNTGFAMAQPAEIMFDIDGNLIAFVADDQEAHYYDATTTTSTSTSLASVLTPSVQGDQILVRVQEQALDLNGDGDVLDAVLHRYSIGSGAIQNLGLAGGVCDLGGAVELFYVMEGEQAATDFNADGDADDAVLFMAGSGSSSLSNSNLALVSPASIFIGEHVTGLLIREGALDLNGDGDTADDVMHVVDRNTGGLQSLGLSVFTGGPAALRPEVRGNLLAFLVSESGQGNSDLNGDSDLFDNVVHVYDGVNGILTPLGLAAVQGPFVDGANVVFGVREVGQGNADLNGDGDNADVVVFTYNGHVGTSTNLQLAVDGNARFGVSGSMVVVQVGEASQGDSLLNGDVDSNDDVVYVHDGRGIASANLSLAAHPGVLAGDRTRMAFLVSETSEGTDLNGDGDGFDLVLYLTALSGL